MGEEDAYKVKGKVLELKDGPEPDKRRRLTAALKRSDSGDGAGSESA